MRRATFLASVRTDLLAIQIHIAEQSGSVAVAETFVKTLRTHCHKLASFDATVGRPRSELRAGMRSVPYRGHVIFFRYLSDRFEVVNIIEGHRDVVAFFNERQDL